MYEITQFDCTYDIEPPKLNLPIGQEAFRAGVLALQDDLAKLPQIDPPLKHHYAEGSYAREMLIPKGAIIIGKIHRHSHVNVISKGRIYVATEFGSEILQAPYTFISKPGTKRAVYALEDTVWTTIHVTEETDLEKIEEVVIAPDYETFEREQRLLK
jgi:quercetin dioxygenase-like cupin family protein